ncbi:MAG: hypothetical protein DRQ47_08090, partial [Gammaproteobacteria bacterium]
MKLDSKKVQITIIVSLIIIFIIGSYVIVTQEIENIESTIAERATERVNKATEKVVLIRSFIKTMGKHMEQSISLHEADNDLHPALDRIEDYPQINASAIVNQTVYDRFNINGTFTSIGTKSELMPEQYKEISAAFSLQSIFESAVDSIPDLKWVYYISKENFWYIVPNLALNVAYFDKKNYQNDSWVKALPENNVERRLVMSSIYEDAAGKGYMVSFVMPVYHDEQFKGIIGIDVSLEQFSTSMSTVNTMGDSFLIDEQNLIIVSSLLKEPDEIQTYIKEKVVDNSLKFDHQRYDYLNFEVFKGEINFVHQIKREQKVKAAFINSLRELLLLLSLAIMAYMIYYFRILIFQVGLLANTDPLTSLLNRRAMENAVLPLLNINERYEQQMCFLLADIDHFKIVNDNYGHIVGDEVLVSITEVLSSCLRSSDLLSRHGGEEFFIVLPQTDLESGALLAERIRTSIENTRTSENKVAVTISVGCIEVRDEESFDSAITRADNMLYEAKSTGR